MERMDGIRHFAEIDCGVPFGREWERAFATLTLRCGDDGSTKLDDSSAEYPATGNHEISYQSVETLVGEMAAGESVGIDDSQLGDAKEEVEEGTEGMSPTERRVWRIIEATTLEPEWCGTEYRLLGKNCNSFTDELCWRLTGRRAPSWINRSKYLAINVPCLVPEGWIGDEDLQQATTTSQTAIIAPPRADRSIVLLGIMFLKYVVFEDPAAAREQAKRRAIVRSKRIRDRSASSRSTTLPTDDPTLALLSCLGYDLPSHPAESLDWMNVLLAQTVIGYRNIIAASTTGAGGARGFMENVLNRKGKGEGVDEDTEVEQEVGLVGIDRIEVGEVELGEKFPVLSNARVRPSGQNGGVRIELDVDFSDHVHLAISTSLLVNFPRPRFAILPVSLGLTLEHFSGTVTLELPSPTSLLANSPTLLVSLHPDFTLQLSTTSLLGSRAKLQDIPKVEQLILARIRGWIQDRVVWPGRVEVGLPAIARGPANSPGEDLEGWEWVEESTNIDSDAEISETDDRYSSLRREKAIAGEDIPEADATDGGPSIQLRTKIRRRPLSISSSPPPPFNLNLHPAPLSSTAPPSPTESIPGHLPSWDDDTTFVPRKNAAKRATWAPGSSVGLGGVEGGLRYRTNGPVGVGVGMSPAQSLNGRAY